MKKERPNKKLYLGLLCLIAALLACGLGPKANQALDGYRNPGPPTLADGPVAYMAKLLQQSLIGEMANIYPVTDAPSGSTVRIPIAPGYGPQQADTPLWAAAQEYWYNGQRCRDANPNGGVPYLCSLAYSGNLQCVQFVTAVFSLVQDPLPYKGNGEDFYPNYVGRPGWKTLPANKYANYAYENLPVDDLPQKGDMAGYGGGAFGHIAIVVDVKGPDAHNDGYITLANANAPGTTYPGSSQGGNFASFTWRKDGSFDLGDSLAGTGEYLQGFIRHVDGKPKLQLFDYTAKSLGLQDLSVEQQKWAFLAVAQAQRFKISPVYFVKQIKQESGFNANAKSSAGAIGIAQFLPGTAATIPRCILNPTEPDPLNCQQHDSSRGIDPANPVEAIPAAAYYMATHYQHYLKKCPGSTAMDCQVDVAQTYARSLAAYNAGRGATDSALDRCGTTWLLCMDQNQPDHQTRDYISIIMGCGVVTESGAVCTKG